VDTPALSEVASFIKDIIDFEGSSLEARFIIKRGVDEEVSPSIDESLQKAG
jgi:hypothetical protein